MQSLSAYGITSTSFTTEIHPSFYILIPILVLALLMALLAPFCLLRAFVRATRHGCLPILDGWVWGREGTMSSLAQHADGFVRPTGHAIQLSKACRHPRLGNATPKRKVCRKVHTSTFYLIFDPGKKRCRESEGLWKFALLQLVSRLACLVEYTLSSSAHILLHTTTLFDNCRCSGRFFEPLSRMFGI